MRGLTLISALFGLAALLPAQQPIGGRGSGATGGQIVAQIVCDQHTYYSAATSGSTQLVALASGQKIYVCGYTLASSSTNTNTIYLQSGTGTACASNTTQLTPAWVLQATAAGAIVGLSVNAPAGSPGFVTASGYELCIDTSAAVSAQLEIWYTQF